MKPSHLCDILTFRNGKKRPKKSGVFPVYGGNGILGYADSYNYENCIIIGRVGAYCGSVYYEPNKCWVSDNAIATIPKETANTLYSYYLLQNLSLNKRHIGTSQPLLTQDILNNIECFVPSIVAQEQIASILRSLDDRIDNNNRTNHHLEQIAQAIFKSWFVDFEPWGGVMPEDWQIGKISDLGEVIGGSTPSKAKPEYFTEHGVAWITPKDLSVNKNKFVARGAEDITEIGLRNSSARLMPRGAVLFSSRAPIGYIAIAKNELCTNQGFKSIVPNMNASTAFIYFFLVENLNVIKSMASGSTFMEISGATMRNVPAIIPNVSTLHRFQEECSRIFEMQELFENENTCLQEIRDTLLPRLLSGELSVSDLPNIS